MTTTTTTQQMIESYLRAIESRDLDRVASLLHDDIELVEHPNRISPKGARHDKAAMRLAGERGNALLASQRYEVRSMIVDGDRAAVLTVWSGTLANAAGALPAGHVMRAQICSVIHVKDGKIWRQEQYDCFE